MSARKIDQGRRGLCRGIAGVALVASLVGCREADTTKFVEDIEFMGLTVKRPNGWVATLAEGVMTLREEGNLRMPGEVRLTLSANAPEVADAQKRGDTRFSIATLSGGSGGATYELTAWRAAGDRFLVMTAARQSEFGVPEFQVEWAIFEAVEP